MRGSRVWNGSSPGTPAATPPTPIFSLTPDPPTLTRQGADVGTQYRSAIFAGSPQQEQSARELVAELNAEQVFDAPIVTEIVPLREWYPAEAYHRDYYDRNRAQPYCQLVITPKLAKLRKQLGNAPEAAE